MHLKILLPGQVFADLNGVTSIVAEGELHGDAGGSFGLLPQRLDCVSVLAPGILSYRLDSDAEVYLAVDEGVLVKVGPEVLVSVRRAIKGANLPDLQSAVTAQFLTLNKQEQESREAERKLEANLFQGLDRLEGRAL